MVKFEIILHLGGLIVKTQTGETFLVVDFLV